MKLHHYYILLSIKYKRLIINKDLLKNDYLSSQMRLKTVDWFTVHQHYRIAS